MYAHRSVLRPLAAALLAATFAVPAIAQPTGGAIDGSAPGSVSASRIVTASVTPSQSTSTTRWR